MKRKKKNKAPFIWFNTDITYTMPMVPEGEYSLGYDEVPVEGVSITQSEKDGFVHATKLNYQDKWFIDVYFDWLLYTGYIKKEA